MDRDAPRPLGELFRAVSGVRVPAPVASLRVRRLVADAREVEPGDLFVALRGHRTDGHEHAGEAVRRGAVAVVAERDPGIGGERPVLRVPDTRRALAELAAAWYGQPARRLSLVGITGSFGKTGTLNMLDAILGRAGIRAGIIGSDFLGLRLPGEPREPQLLTTPDPLALHRALARIAERGGQICAMEVTSQGLVQGRVHGLEFAVGIFTCIAPLEHADYHGSFRRYVEAKARFLEHVRPGAPLVYPLGERVVGALVETGDATPVPCGVGSGACVRIRRRRFGPERIRMVLEVARPLPRADGGAVEPVCVPIELRLLGRMNARNAALAAVAGLCLGASPAAVREGLAAVRPPPRRLHYEWRGSFNLLDDTATHPEALCVLFEVIAGLRRRRLHLVAAIRGGRGAELNRRYGETIAIWSRKLTMHTLVATSSDEAVDAADRVAAAEREAFLAELRRAAVDPVHHDRLDDAIRHALGRVGDGDLLVLLGTQGMHPGAELVRRWTEGEDRAR
ncbi:MAG TPA: Mur ligase family protein [Longimicrobiales bacterium]